MITQRSFMPSLLVILVALTAPSAKGDLIDFSGVNLASILSATGQDFSYTIGAGPSGGIVNVRVLSGDIDSVQPGDAPDPTGLYLLQGSPNLSPLTLQVTFDAVRALKIHENETLTAFEENTFSMPSGTWTLLSSQDATVSNSGSVITIVGNNNSPPWGSFSISGTTQVFDWEIDNSAGFSLYGSAISIDVVPEPSVLALIVCCLPAVFLRWSWA